MNDTSKNRMNEAAQRSLCLPDGWKLDSMPSGEIIIEAYIPTSGAFLGAVSVSESKRNFCLGAVVVKNSGPYRGRGWPARLYEDAINVLKQTVSH